MTTYSYDDLRQLTPDTRLRNLSAGLCPQRAALATSPGLTGRSYTRAQNSPSYPTTQGADAFTYDRAGRMLTAEHVQGADTFDLTLAYDAAGRVLSVDQDGNAVTHQYAVNTNDHYVLTTYPSDRPIRHTLDARGRVTSAADYATTQPTELASNTYDLDNRMTHPRAVACTRCKQSPQTLQR